MRNKIFHHHSFNASITKHEYTKYLKQIDVLLKDNKEIFNLVHADLIRDLKDPNKERTGLLSAEQVFRIFLIKQMNGFSYEELHFRLMDSRSCRAFCDFKLSDNTPSIATITGDIKKLCPETLEKIKQILLETAKAKGVKISTKVERILP